MSERWFLDGMVTQGKQEDWTAGIAAFVWLYYNEYSDATEIESGALNLLIRLHRDFLAEDEDDALDAIRNAELDLNNNGGVMSATTNTRHRVATPAAWNRDTVSDS